MKTVPRAFFGWQALIALAVVAGLIFSYSGWRWDAVKSRIRSAHPQLIILQTHELAAWLANPQAKQPILFDVRTPEEFAISHLVGARLVAPDAQPSELELPAQRDAPIVTYCSIGERSAQFADRLRGAGYTRVYHLDGALFKWANEDRLIVNAKGSTSTVHPQNSTWQPLLEREHRTEVWTPVP